MPQPPPFRRQPSLHLSLRPLTESPTQNTKARAVNTPVSSNLPTPLGTPLGATAYSPFRSAGLQPPTPHGQAMSSKLRRRGHTSRSGSICTRLRRSTYGRLVWITLMAFCVVFWWCNGGKPSKDQIRLHASNLGQEIFSSKRLQGYRFFPASNPKIHFIGRWTSTPNRLRKDGTFPGVYFDIQVTNTTTILLSLHNKMSLSTAALKGPSTSALPNPGHFSFKPISASENPSKPVSLLAQVDDEEYILLPNSSSLVTVCMDSLDINREHSVRIIAPMTDDGGQGVVEFEGIWLGKDGKLLKVPGSTLNEDYLEEDLLEAENDHVGKDHRLGLEEIGGHGARVLPDREQNHQDERSFPSPQERRKIVEIVTDSPGSLTEHTRGRRSASTTGLISGVTAWEYLVGEMFGVDHVGISVNGMCLIQDCFGSTGFPAGIGDVFFRSGPYDSEYFQHSWAFNTYVPDVIILNLGEADHRSFERYQETYNKSYFDLSAIFETTYSSLIKGIRRLAYPKHPAIIESEVSGYSGQLSPDIPAAIPIFVMRPFRGQLEQATQTVVGKLRADGDKAVFWLDTSGWLDTDPESGDFVLADDEELPSGALTDDGTDETHKKWRLTEQGNQRVAIFLHVHVCRYLATSSENCAFLPQEVYQGKIFDPDEANLNRYLENEKERRLRKVFWGSDAVRKDGEGESDRNEPTKEDVTGVETELKTENTLL